jgi:hypothetical protein
MAADQFVVRFHAGESELGVGSISSVGLATGFLSSTRHLMTVERR